MTCGGKHLLPHPVHCIRVRSGAKVQPVVGIDAEIPVLRGEYLKDAVPDGLRHRLERSCENLSVFHRRPLDVQLHGSG